MSCDCKYPVALPHCAVGWSADCDCGISLTYLLTIPLPKFRLLLSADNLCKQFWFHIRTDRIGSKIVNEYDQEIPQSQTADNPVAP